MSLLIVNLISPVFSQTTFDPLAISVGARALGMGKAYVAVAEEGDAIFNNPAGLGEIDSFQFTSMSAKILEDANYVVLGTVYPLGTRSALGIGYAAVSLSGIDIRDSEGTYQSRSDFSNGVFLASYGRKLTEKISLGANFKYFFQHANEQRDGNGVGLNLDVGYLQKGLGWFSLGAVGKNILTTSSMHYQNGTEEKLPVTFKIGARMHIMGKEFESAVFSPLKLIAVADAEINMQSPQPSTAHAGIEFSPNHNLTLRGGLDQNPKGGGVENHLTGGVTLRLAGIGFHYAYHPYGEIQQNATHYFSLSFDERGWPYEGPPDIFLGSLPE